jgi:uncharacterized protein YggL (DUF469 family)
MTDLSMSSMHFWQLVYRGCGRSNVAGLLCMIAIAMTTDIAGRSFLAWLASISNKNG